MTGREQYGCGGDKSGKVQEGGNPNSAEFGPFPVRHCDGYVCF